MDMAKMVMIYLSISIVLYAAGVKVIQGENFIDRFVELDSEGNVVGEGQSLNQSTPTQFEQQGAGSTIPTFVDAIFAVQDFIFFIVNITFAPLGFLIATNMPNVVRLFLGLPLVVAYLLGFITFIRGAN